MFILRVKNVSFSYFVKIYFNIYIWDDLRFILVLENSCSAPQRNDFRSEMFRWSSVCAFQFRENMSKHLIICERIFKKKVNLGWATKNLLGRITGLIFRFMHTYTILQQNNSWLEQNLWSDFKMLKFWNFCRNANFNYWEKKNVMNGKYYWPQLTTNNFIFPSSVKKKFAANFSFMPTSDISSILFWIRIDDQLTTFLDHFFNL